MLEFFAVFTSFLAISVILLANQRMLQLVVIQSFKQASDPTIEKKNMSSRNTNNLGSLYVNS